MADPRTRLDSDDALFVDVIHTNGGSNYIEGIKMNSFNFQYFSS